MSKQRGPTKAQVILQETKARLEQLQEEEREAARQLNVVNEKRKLCQVLYDALELALARKPRSTNGTGKSSSPAPSVKKKSSRVRNLNELPTVNTEDETVNVSNAADSADVDNYMARG